VNEKPRAYSLSYLPRIPKHKLCCTILTMDEKQTEIVPPQPETTIEPVAAVQTESAVPDTPLAEGINPDQGDSNVITWTASEYIDNAKSFDWYLSLGVAAVLIAGLFYLLFKDLITSTVVIVCALALGYYARRRPEQLEYQLDSHGLIIAGKNLPYGLFRSFAVIDEGHFSSVVFMPLKRFGLMTTIYYAPEDEDRIIDLVGQYLPFEQRKQDPIDRLMRRIRF
jgi:hypothetical protein